MKLKTLLLGLLLFAISIVLPFWIIIPYFIVYLNNLLSLPVFDYPYLKIVGTVFIFFGLIGSLHTFFLFRKFGRGTPAPIIPTKKLVVKGFYRYTRNPMYLSYILVVLGVFFLTGAILLIIYLVIFFLIFNFYVVKFEEPNLKKKFGHEYIKYSKKVHRWL